MRITRQNKRYCPRHAYYFIVIHGTIYRVVPAGPVPSAFGSYNRGEGHDFEDATLPSNTTQTVISPDTI